MSNSLAAASRTLLTTRSIDGVSELGKLPLGEVILLPGCLLLLCQSMSSCAPLEGAVGYLRLDGGGTGFGHRLGNGLLRTYLVLSQTQRQFVVSSLLLLCSKPARTVCVRSCDNIISVCVVIGLHVN